MNRIELSKSSRAMCRICKAKIEKDKPRLGEEYEFSMGSSVRTGIRWFHLDCAISKSPDMVIQAEITMELPDDIAKNIEELKKRGMQTAFAVKGFSDIKEDDSKVNVKGTVLRT
ncbi:MAG: PARP-type zinc finger-containing protein, partial [Candidatus Heimdallarchaeota archaeon]